MPCLGLHRKYVIFLTVPLLRPAGFSHWIPTHLPLANFTGPRNFSIPFSTAPPGRKTAIATPGLCLILERLDDLREDLDSTFVGFVLAGLAGFGVLLGLGVFAFLGFLVMDFLVSEMSVDSAELDGLPRVCARVLEDELRVGVSNRALPVLLTPFAAEVFEAIAFLLNELLAARVFDLAGSRVFLLVPLVRLTTPKECWRFISASRVALREFKVSKWPWSSSTSAPDCLA